jgi:hypothetical protein
MDYVPYEIEVTVFFARLLARSLCVLGSSCGSHIETGLLGFSIYSDRQRCVIISILCIIIIITHTHQQMLTLRITAPRRHPDRVIAVLVLVLFLFETP